MVKHTNKYLYPFVLLYIYFLYSLTATNGVQLLELNTVIYVKFVGLLFLEILLLFSDLFVLITVPYYNYEI